VWSRLECTSTGPILARVAHGDDAIGVLLHSRQLEVLAFRAGRKERLAGPQKDWVHVETIFIDKVGLLQRLNDAGATLKVDGFAWLVP
jgi:hypothetical protein